MIVFYLIGFLLLCAATVILLGLTPESITDDLMRFVSPKQTLRDKVLIAKGKKKSRRLTNEILHIKDALDATGKGKQFCRSGEPAYITNFSQDNGTQCPANAGDRGNGGIYFNHYLLNVSVK